MIDLSASLGRKLTPVFFFGGMYVGGEGEVAGLSGVVCVFDWLIYGYLFWDYSKS